MHHYITSGNCWEIANGLDLLLKEKGPDVDKLTESGKIEICQLRDLFRLLSQTAEHGDDLEFIYKVEFVGSRSYRDE